MGCQDSLAILDCPDCWCYLFCHEESHCHCHGQNPDLSDVAHDHQQWLGRRNTWCKILNKKPPFEGISFEEVLTSAVQWPSTLANRQEEQQDQCRRILDHGRQRPTLEFAAQARHKTHRCCRTPMLPAARSSGCPEVLRVDQDKLHYLNELLWTITTGDKNCFGTCSFSHLCHRTRLRLE